jgi:hypothetical protein
MGTVWHTCEFNQPRVYENGDDYVINDTLVSSVGIPDTYGASGGTGGAEGCGAISGVGRLQLYDGARLGSGWRLHGKVAVHVLDPLVSMLLYSPWSTSPHPAARQAVAAAPCTPGIAGSGTSVVNAALTANTRKE